MSPLSRPPHPYGRRVDPKHPNLQPTAMLHDGKEMFEVICVQSAAVTLENIRTEARFVLVASVIVDRMTLVRPARTMPDFVEE